MRTLVFTAIFGGYDELKQPQPQDVPCDFVCFTDSHWPRWVGNWRIYRVKSDSNLHPRIQAKRFKIQSHEILPHGRLAFAYDAIAALRRRYGSSIWVDGSIAIKSSAFARDMTNSIGQSGWALFQHPDRECIFEEAAVSEQMSKYQGLPIRAQVEHYRRSGVRPKGGLWACGVIARREPLRKGLRELNDAWWAENLRWTYQDQLSLPFVLEKKNERVDVIHGSVWNNRWFDYIEHKTDL